MDKLWKILIFFFIFLIFLALGLFLGQKYYESWGRRLIYPAQSSNTKYPGIGKTTEFLEEQIFVVPRYSGLSTEEGRPFFDEPDDRDKYPSGEYDVFQIPSQERLLFAVGKFEGWENIEGSLDRYIIVSFNDDQFEKYRLAFEESDLFGENPTYLAVEKVEIRSGMNVNTIDKPEKSRLSDLSFDTLERLIKRGDSVILLPVFEAPEFGKRDAGGNFLTAWLIVRRLGGVSSFNEEMKGVQK